MERDASMLGDAPAGGAGGGGAEAHRIADAGSQRRSSIPYADVVSLDAASRKIVAPAAGRNKGPIADVLGCYLKPRTDGRLVRLFEVASGGEQHAAHLVATLPHLVVQPSDPLPAAIESCRAYRAELPEDSEGGEAHHGLAHSAGSAATLGSGVGGGRAWAPRARFLTPLLLDVRDAEARTRVLATGRVASVSCSLHGDAAATAAAGAAAGEVGGGHCFDAVLAVNLCHIAPWAATEGLVALANDALAPCGLLFVYGPFLVNGQPTTPSNAEFDGRLKELDAAWSLRDVAAVAAAAAAQGLQLVERREMPANNFMLVFERSP